MFFNGWQEIARTFIVGIFAYMALVIMLRISGKRTLSKMNAFDFVVTVALGSILATILLSKDVALAEGITAFALLIGLQFVITWLSVRSKTVRQIVKSDPSLLFYQGEFIEVALYTERVTREEVIAAIREQGIPVLENVEAVILETDGSFSVLKRAQEPASVLKTVKNYPPSE